MRWDQQFLDEILDLFMEAEGVGFHHEHLEREKVRAVTRMLLVPLRSDCKSLRKNLISETGSVPYDALVVSHEDRFLTNTRLIHSTYAFILPTRSPPINVHCSARSFAYKAIEELHNLCIKRLFIGFARTSDGNGPREPRGPSHHLIQEIDLELPVAQPILHNTFKIFGSCPPMQSFDLAKMLTDSGKLQTLDILLKRLQAGNHRVLLFAQMTKNA